MMDSSEHPEHLEHCHQIESSIKIDGISSDHISKIYALLEDQNQLMKQNQSSIQELTLEVAEVVMILYQQQELDSAKAIEATKQEVITLNQGVTGLAQGVLKIYRHLEKDDIGKELKSGQQNLQKIIEANSQKKNTTNIGYLNWKQIATIITAAAVVSSLCSLAVFQVAANWKTNQTPIPTKKPLKPKKTAK